MVSAFSLFTPPLQAETYIYRPYGPRVTSNRISPEEGELETLEFTPLTAGTTENVYTPGWKEAAMQASRLWTGATRTF
jgi:hypothetical protein